MQEPTRHTPVTGTTRADVAAVFLLALLGAVVALAAVVSISPAPLGGVAVVALALGVVGVIVGASIERGTR